jgi:transcriptional regulator of acetoin/glycerol metabolism
MGTNGAGTALVTDMPVAVIGPDHYQLPFHETACLGCPIHGSSGELVGAIDLSMHASRATPTHISDVVRLATHIERRLAGKTTVLQAIVKYSNRLPRSAVAARSGAIVSRSSSYFVATLAEVMGSTWMVLALSLPVTVAFWPANLSIAALFPWRV